jgi:acyl-CoA thioesterase-1
MSRLRVAIFVCVIGIAASLPVFLAACNLNYSDQKPDQKGTPIQTPGTMTSTTSNISSTPITGPVNYVALGDSTGAGVGAREGGYVARLFRHIVTQRPSSKLTNLCVSGATSSDVLRNQLDRGVGEGPNLVTLGIGINDIGHGVSLEQFSRNYEEILSRLKNNTRAAIVVTNIPDISSAPRIPELMRREYHELIKAFNERLQEIALRHGVTVFDVYEITHEQLPLHPEYFSADGFHPSDKGYELWAEQMWPTIASTIGVASR